MNLFLMVGKRISVLRGPQIKCFKTSKQSCGTEVTFEAGLSFGHCILCPYPAGLQFTHIWTLMMVQHMSFPNTLFLEDHPLVTGKRFKAFFTC